MTDDELLAFDRNTWNHLPVCKHIVTANSLKSQNGTLIFARVKTG